MVDALPKNAKNAPSKKNGSGSFRLALKPTEGNNVYRVRLLSFLNGTNTRDWPFIEKFVHEKWEKNAEGKGAYKGFVTCPATKYVRPTLPAKANPFEICPICKYTNANFLAYKESGYKDKLAGKITREHKRKYVALIPVWVVKDPHEPTNINKCRVWVIKDKENYDKLNAMIKKQTSKVFNAGPAVDLLIYVKKETEIINEGKENEFKLEKTVIDKFGFGKQEYKIDAITDQLIEEFPFDDEFYTFSTIEELQKYYEENVISNSNIPEDTIDTDELENTSATPVESASTPEETVIEEEPKTQEAIIDQDLSDIDGIIDNAIIEEKTPAKKPGKPQLKEPEPKKEPTLDDIDGLIDDICK